MKRLTLIWSMCLMIISGNLQADGDYPAISEFAKEMKSYEGYFKFYYDEKEGKIYLEIDNMNEEFLYVNSLAAGVGSNDIGLDRGQLGNTRVVKFSQSGPKVLLVQPNYGYRAVSNNPDEAKSVQEAFAQSVLWGGKIKATSENSVLIDLTSFILRDAHQVSERLSRSNQGAYHMDAARSALYLPMIKNFPQNSEFEGTITFSGKPTGDWIKSVTPTPSAVTVRMHHSFIQLPDDDYQPRAFDPRAGYNYIRYQDYATPIDQPLVKQFIRRHRLEKKDPSAEMSEAVEPIVYYVDRGAPEPIKSALVEGATWWNQAFEAAGYQNAFQVKIMPEDADPMDVRYNLIQWVHRSTRGWSYGASVADPRTGEIIKGHVSLGSLRVRQDFLIAEGLLAPYEEGQPVSDEMLKMALARLRQLSAHEVGHTLGLQHNFASSYNNRASVMDYPHPLVKMDDQGKIDLSDAYDVGIGEWDKQTIKYGYQDFPEGTDEQDGLGQIIRESFDLGLYHISDQDARPMGGAHPKAHLWDNGTNTPVDELERMLAIRKSVMSNFSENNIAPGAPMSTLEEAFVPMYLFHRYQIEAVAKLVGGLNYTYAVKGDGQPTTEMIAPDLQMEAVDALIDCTQPDQLKIPEALLTKIPPRAFGYPRTRETFKVRTGLTFDALGVAETAANVPIAFLLHPQRAARLVEYHARDAKQPGLNQVLNQLVDRTWKAKREDGYAGEIQRTTEKLVLNHMIGLAANTNASEQVRALALMQVQQLKNWADQASGNSDEQKAHLSYASYQIDRFMNNPDKAAFNSPLAPPDGSPIGSGQMLEWCSGGF